MIFSDLLTLFKNNAHISRTVLLVDALGDHVSMFLQAYTDYSDSVSRRMGFIPLPLALLVSHSFCATVMMSVCDYFCISRIMCSYF